MNHGLQSGAVLLLCLFLLMALSLLGLAAASDSQMQQRASGNIQALHEQQQLAKRAQAWAEAWLMSLPGSQRPAPCSEPCSAAEVIRPGGHYADAPLSSDIDWWISHATPAGFAPDRGTMFTLGGNPQRLESYWLVEEIHVDQDLDAEETIDSFAWYLVTAAAGSDSEAYLSVTQGIVVRPWGDAAFSDPLPAGDSRFCDGLSAEFPCGRQAWQALN